MITSFRFDNSDFNEYASMILALKSTFTEMIANDLNSSASYPKSFRCVNLLNSDSSSKNALFFTRLFTNTYVERHGLIVSHAAYYGEHGFIDWHTNANAPYYNAICTYSSNGNGFFEYKRDEEVVRMQDSIGWSVKKSKWGDSTQSHRALSNGSDRITITFSSEEENRVDAFITSLNNIDIVPDIVEEEIDVQEQPASHPFLNQAPPMM